MMSHHNQLFETAEKHFFSRTLHQTQYAYRAFSHDVTAAILVFQNNETVAMLVFQTNPLAVELFSYVS